MDLKAVLDVGIEVGNLLGSYFASPEKRLYGGYLISSLFLAYFVFWRTKQGGSFIKYVFDKRIWLSRSSQVDYTLILFNGFVKVLLISHFLLYGLHLAFWVGEYLRRFSFLSSVGLSQTQTIVGYTIALSVLGDLSVYGVHRLMHEIPFLWRFHSVHHSATTLTPLTQLRLHPVELIINNLRSVLIFGLVTGIFDALSSYAVSKWTFLGVNVFGFVFFAFGANLRHSHVPLRYWSFIEYVFVSPYQHQIHHSSDPAHHNRNYGSKFALWDWIFGTLVRSKGVEHVRFGLHLASHKHNSFVGALVSPFRKL